MYKHTNKSTKPDEKQKQNQIQNQKQSGPTKGCRSVRTQRSATEKEKRKKKKKKGIISQCSINRTPKFTDHPLTFNLEHTTNNDSS
jgi:hypothetical protein